MTQYFLNITWDILNKAIRMGVILRPFFIYTWFATFYLSNKCRSMSLKNIVLSLYCLNEGSKWVEHFYSVFLLFDRTFFFLFTSVWIDKAVNFTKLCTHSKKGLASGIWQKWRSILLIILTEQFNNSTTNCNIICQICSANTSKCFSSKMLCASADEIDPGCKLAH